MIKRISKTFKRIPIEIRFMGYGILALLLMQLTELPYSYYFEFMLIIQIAIYMYVSLAHEIPTIKVSLFVDGEFIDKMNREIAPSKGDTIVIDCGDMVEIIAVNYHWDEPNFVQINCIPVKEDKKDG